MSKKICTIETADRQTHDSEVKGKGYTCEKQYYPNSI